MPGLNRFIALLCVYFCAYFLGAQDPYSIAFTTENGLPSNSVYAIFQDKKGFIWIASDAGLTCFDGFEFKTYTCDEQSSKSGSNIFEDHLGRIWYQNFDGFLFFVANDKMHPLRGQRPTGYFPAGVIDDHLYTAESRCIAIYDLNTLKPLKKVATKYLAGTYCSKQYFYVLGTQFFRLDYAGNKRPLKMQKRPISQLPSLAQIGKKGLWLMEKSERSKYCYKLTADTIVPIFAIPRTSYIQNVAYSPSRFWLCTTNGVYAHSEAYPTQQSRHYFPEKNISCVFYDRSGNHWFGTQNSGILLVPDLNRKLLFSSLRPRKVVVRGNTIFMSTGNDRIFRINPQKNTSQLFYDGHTNHMINQLYYPPGQEQLFFTSNSFHIVNQSGAPSQEFTMAAKDYVVLDDGYFAFAASGICGISQIRPCSTSLWEKKYLANKRVIEGKTIWMVMGDLRGKSVNYNPRNKHIYFATNLGLFAFDGTKTQEISYLGKRIYVARLVWFKGQLYALSTSGKIFTIDDRHRLSYVSKKWGLSDEIILNLETSEDKLLISAKDWVYVIDRIKKRPYSKRFPTYGREITSLACWQNQLLMSSERGILMFPLYNKKTHRSLAHLVINAIQINGKKYAGTAKHLLLSNNQNDIEINYSVLDFNQSQASYLRYRINNKAWVTANPNSRTLRLASLSPGAYTVSFRLDDSSKRHFVRFTIEKPWYAKWWFVSIAFLTFFSVVYFYFRWRIQRLQQRNRLLSEKILLEEDLTRSMLTSIKSQMNPHFFYNALNTIQFFIFTNDRQNASTYLSKFSKLTRMILEMSDKEYVGLKEEINALTLYLDIEKVRFDGDFEYTIETGEALETELIRIPSMFIQPYVENAIKHGLLHKKGPKMLSIVLEAKAGELEITIDDNGIGRQQANELNKRKNDNHKSFATSANQKRLDLLNKGRNASVGVRYIDKLKDGRSEGTTVIITIPISN